MVHRTVEISQSHKSLAVASNKDNTIGGKEAKNKHGSESNRKANDSTVATGAAPRRRLELAMDIRSGTITSSVPPLDDKIRGPSGMISEEILD